MSDEGPARLAVAADVVLFTERDGVDHVLLIQRRNDPFQGRWAFPGGFVEEDEDLTVAASRELTEETGIEVATASLRQLGAYGAPGRDPRMRVVSVVFVTRASEPMSPRGGSDATAARLFPVEEVIADPGFLAFDHHMILNDAIELDGEP